VCFARIFALRIYVPWSSDRLLLVMRVLAFCFLLLLLVLASVESTIWVHKIDVAKRGIITEADYCVFKLMQLQKVDEHTLARLCNRFAELDLDGGEIAGGLEIGHEIPSKQQVLEMMSLTYGSKMSLQEAWANHYTGRYKLKTEAPVHEIVLLRDLRDSAACLIQVPAETLFIGSILIH